MELSQGLVQKYRGGGEEGWAGAFGSVVDKKKKKKKNMAHPRPSAQK